MSSKFEKDVYQKFAQFDEKFKKIDERFEKVDERFQKIDERFAKIDERFQKIDERFAKIDERFAKLEKDISFMKDDIAFTSKRVDNIENILVSMQQTMENMNKSIILIEHTLTTKIPALFDGYSMHQEKQEIQQENIDSLNVKVEEHDVRISSLEQVII